jgi:hypothetical protein
MAFQQVKISDVESSIRLYYEGRAFTVRMEGRPGLGFWNVESDRRTYRSPLRIKGNEPPDFFENLVQMAVEKYGV